MITACPLFTVRFHPHKQKVEIVTGLVKSDYFFPWYVLRMSFSHAFSLGWYKKRPHPKRLFSAFPLLDRKVSLWHGDITHLEIGAIVNAANSSLLGGNVLDAAIEKAAGSSLYEECQGLNDCPIGQTKLTSGHSLPAKCK